MLQCQDKKFSIPDHVHYLNCAYMSPMLKPVEAAGRDEMIAKRDPSAIHPEDFFNKSWDLRSEFARLINLDDPHQVAIIPSVSYGMANAANNIPLSGGDEIVLLDEQFPSNVYVWMEKAKQTGAKIVTVKAPLQGGEKWNEAVLEAINKNTRVVAMGNVHWTDGTFFDLEAVSGRVREVGAYLIVDGTQSVGALPFDVKRVKPDVLICAGYKWLLGPYGIGLGYYSDRFNNGEPIEYHWITRLKSEDFAGLVNYEGSFQPGALRYDMGERSNFILVAMQLAALRQINSWGIERMQEYIKGIVSQELDPLSEAGFSLAPCPWRSHHLFGIRLGEGHNPKKINRRLDENHVRISVRGSAIRISPNVYNSKADIQALVCSLTGKD